MLPIPTLTNVPKIALRDYQTTCVERVLSAYQLQPRGGKALIVLPTGGGKTIVFAETARRLEVNTLIIAHRQELLQQAADKFRMLDPTAIIGQVGAGRYEYGAPVTVASIQTISRPEHLKNLRLFDYGLVIIDECHHSAASGYQAVLEKLPDAFVLGVTATPDRLDGQNIEAIFGEPIFSTTIVDMVEQGYLCDLRAIAVRTTTSLDSVHTQAGDFKQDELEEVIDTHERNYRVVNAYTEHCRGRQSLCFAVTVAHATHLMQTFRDAGISAEIVSGETPLEERTRILHDYERGTIEVLCNCGVLTEGYDCLDAETEILTPQGWKGRGEVVEGDAIYSLNKATGKMEIVPTLSYIEREVKEGERMFTIQSQHMNIRTTEGHEFHIKYRDPQKGGALSDTWLTLTGNELAHRRSAYALPLAAERDDLSGVPLTDDELRFIAWFMTDGGFTDFSSLCINQAKEYHQEIRELLDRLGLDYLMRLRTRPSGYAGDRGLPVYEFKIPKGTDKAKPRNGWGKYAPYLSKDVSPLLNNMTRRQFSVFWAELLKGDGSMQGNKAGWLWCDRKTQVNAYTHLAVVRGFTTSYREEITSSGSVVWRVTVRNTQWITSDPNDKRSARIVLEPPQEHEKVWCVRNINSTLITRRHGKVVIIGNCPQTSCIIMARPTKSRPLYVQCVGRGTRLAPGKANCIILDVTDNCLKHRLEPQSLAKALALPLLDGESITEAKQRERLGYEQKERTDIVTKRTQDLVVDILARMDWKRHRSNGAYTLEIGKRKHKIMLIPSEQTDGYYSVWAELAPDYRRQQWLKDSPLEWAQQHAEMKARLLQSDDKKRILVDNHAAWRAQPASLKQICLLRKYNVPFVAEITSGEASDLIGKAFADKERAKAEKAAKKGQRKRQQRGKVSA